MDTSRPVVAAVVVAAALVLTACGAGGAGGAVTSPAGPVASATSDGVVPFRALPPSGRSLPETLRPRSPDPDAAQGVPLCRADDLAVSSEEDGAMGTRFVNVTLASRTGAPCVLSGHPKVRAVTTPSSRQVPTRDRDRMPAYGGRSS